MTTEPDTERIAIVGMAGRFPKAWNIDEYWRNLREGVECISFPNDGDGADESDRSAGPAFVPAAATLDGLDLFDAPFFGFSARDAEAMDPQHRIFLECAWHALETAGYNPERCPGLVGVFAGAGLSSYLADVYASAEALASLDDFQIAIGNDKDHLTTQVAYKLNLHGPSLTVQTACSTSLVAVCVACQSLLNYQCDMALAGGVSAEARIGEGYYYEAGGILSPDGHCRVFDAAAQGTVPGNGVGIVVVKRLSDALADRDPIRAIISGFALNNDGLRKVGYTAPSVDGQAEVIAMAHAFGNVDPGSITYVEAHGTGTALGDPIEVAALDQVFRRSGKRGFCAIGSVKSNIGHLDTAAGVASLIKTILALEHRQIPPTLHFTRPNPQINFAESAFRVTTELTEWRSDGEPLRAGVSSFGIGGTNAHVVVEQAPAAEPAAQRRPYVVLTMSARSDAALETATDNLAVHLDQRPDASLADVAYTCQVGRKAFDRRRVLVTPVDDAAGAASALRDRDSLRVRSRACEVRDRPVFFLFPGQGTQAVDMAFELYHAEPRFQREVDRCSEILRPMLGTDLRTLIYPEPERAAEAAAKLGRTAYTQPALFVIEYALARQWMQWGVAPSAMLGHSLGEWVAACLADVVTLEQALELVALRGRLMAEMAPGAMLAAALPESLAAEYLSADLSLAAVNAPGACVLSGPSDAVQEVEAALGGRGIHTQRLATSHAFHSAMMDRAMARFADHIADRVTLRPPGIPFISNVTGTWIEPRAALDPEYWGRQMRETVRFADGVEELCRAPNAVLLEVGPGHTVGRLARQHPALDGRQHVLSTLDSSPGGDALAAMMSALGDLWLHGVEPDWQGFHAFEQRRRVALPTYPFERQRYWIEAPSIAEYEGDDGFGLAGGEPDTAGAETNAADPAGWFYYPSWRPAPPDSPAVTDEAQPSRWLVFGSDVEIAPEVCRVLSDAGHQLVGVRQGDAFEAIGDREYTIRPERPSDYERLLDAVAERFGLPDAVAHLWSAAADGARAGAGGTFARHQDTGFYSLTSLIQALDRRHVSEPMRINIVCSGVYPVIGTEQLCPAKATVIGPCLVIAQEYPNLSCRLIDVEVPVRGGGVGQLARALAAEMTRDAGDVTVAYRNGRRWVQTFDAAYLAPPERADARTRTGGVYLITGGLGRIGAVLAGFLARTVPDVKLVLTGRSVLPPPQEWESFLDGRPDELLALRIRSMLELQANGAEVAYFSADVSDAAEMSRVLEEAERRFGPLAGVIHGAGDTEAYFPVAELERQAAERQFKPKVEGLMVLDELLRARDLDFCVLLSSLSALVGGVGLAGYAAANCFLDALAARRNEEARTPWVNINWGAWHFPGGDDGALDRRPLGATAILPHEGEAAFEAILARAPRQVVVSPRPLRALYDEAVVRHAVAVKATAQAQTPVARHSRPQLATAYAAPRSRAETEIAELWQQLLGVGPIGVFDNFFELGGHSLLAIQLVSRLRVGFGVDAVVSWVFDHSTVAELAEVIEKRRVAIDEDGAEAALELVQGLSESQVEALLADDVAGSVSHRDPGSSVAGGTRASGT